MRRFLVLLAGLSAGGVVAASPVMKPGLWEVTTSMEVQGMPKGMPPMKTQHCYRPEDVKDLRKTMPEQANCKVDDWKQSGNTVTWKTSCSGEMAGTMTGSIKYAGETYSGVNKFNLSRGGQSMQMTQKFDARRIGACK